MSVHITRETFVRFPRRHIGYRGHHARRRRRVVLGAEAEAQAIAGDGRCSTQGAAGIRKYELIWLLQQRLRAVSSPHWRLRCMQPLHGHGMGVVRP